MEVEELGPTQQWVADRSSARSAATALLVQELRRGRIFVLGAVLMLLLAVLLMTDGRTEDDHRPFLALLYAAGLIAFVVGCAVGFAHWQRLRVMRAQLPPGLEMQCQFGPDFLVLRRPWAEARLQFDGYSAVEVVRGWVILRRRGQGRVQVMVPQELLPPADLARLRLVVAGYQPGDPEPPDEPETPDEPEPLEPTGHPE